MQQQRRLAAILFTDIVGSTAVMQKDEQAALTLSKRYVTVLKQCVATSGGEILNDYGDGSLCTFHSATEALRCAINIQQQLQQEPKVPLRVGLHVGEIFFDDGKVFGDGVNVASRVQSLGIANSVLFSSEIYNKIKNQQEFKSVSLGKFHFKNVDEPVEVFALANDGFVVPDKKKIDGKLHEKKRNNKPVLIALGIAIILSLLILFYFKKSYAGTAEEKSVAILPFLMGSNNADNMGSGLVEDILVRLSKIGELKVISNRSSMRFTDNKKSLKEIGEELNVTYIVTGNIEQAGDKIKVSAQLVNAATENTIWAEDYTKDKVQIFELETEVATQIADALKTKLTPEEQKGLSKNYTENVEAYKLYRKGRAFADSRSIASFDSAETNYKRALQIDPDYALAYSGLADCYTYNMKGMSQVEAVPIGRDYALKALALAPNLSEALTTLGWIQGAFDFNWVQSKATLQKAITLNPNYPLAHMYYGNVLAYTGENIEEGLIEVRKALSLDPLSVSINWVLGRNYYLAGKYDSAYTQLKKTLALDSKYNHAISTLIFVLIEQKNFREALALCQQLDPKQPWEFPSVYFCYTYASMGDTARAKDELSKTMKDFPGKSAFELARCNVILKNYSLALDNLEEAYQQKDIRFYNYLKLDPTLDPIRNEPRFKALLKKTNLQ